MRIRDWSSDVCSSDLTIPLPDTKGRIDHLAVDLADRRLFVAEIDNGTVDAIDLDTGKVIGRIVGLAEQQGVAWLPAENELVVAFGDGVEQVPEQQRSEEHTSEHHSIMRISYAVYCSYSKTTHVHTT